MEVEVLLITVKPWFNNGFPPTLYSDFDTTKESNTLVALVLDLKLSGMKLLHDSEPSLQANCRTHA